MFGCRKAVCSLFSVLTLTIHGFLLQQILRMPKLIPKLRTVIFLLLQWIPFFVIAATIPPASSSCKSPALFYAYKTRETELKINIRVSGCDARLQQESKTPLITVVTRRHSFFVLLLASSSRVQLIQQVYLYRSRDLRSSPVERFMFLIYFSSSSAQIVYITQYMHGCKNYRLVSGQQCPQEPKPTTIINHPKHLSV